MLIDDLMDIAHVRFSQSVHLDLGPTDLVRLAEQCVEGQRRPTARHAISVAAMEPTLIGIWDRARLRRVIDNLLSNALKYSPDGGKVVVEIGRERTAVGEWAVLDVRDEGVGIPAADLSIVFECFRRGTNIVGRTSGSGIGLAGAKQIVEQHGGTITAVSEEGTGSTFTVRLPLVEATPS